MAESDVSAQNFVLRYALPVTCLVILMKGFQKVVPQLRHKFFARFIAGMMVGYNKLNHEKKKAHFKSLETVVSKSPLLKNAGKFSLLEVGVGAGANLQYYPSNCVLTVVDPNPYFEEYFDKNHDKFKDIEVERFVVAYGEDMKEVPDNSIDVVVMTLVMCSVRSMDDVLKEVKRVLVPGGKFYFWEHVADQYGTPMHRLQRILNPVWPYVFDGCEINRKSGDLIEKAGFSECELERFYVKCPSHAPLIKRYFYEHILGSHVRGIATK